MAIISYEERFKQNLAASAAQMNQAIADNKAIYDKQAKTVTDNYTGQIAESGLEYDNLERQNAVQKLINEREVAENMANLGLTDSGLNRTQATAVQLSASNNAAKIQRQKQSMVDSLTREMNAYLSEIETGRISSESTIRQQYEQAASDAAMESYKADVEAETKRQEAYYKWLDEQAEAAAEAARQKSVSSNIKGNATGTTSSGGYIISTNGGLLNRDFTGSLDDNDVDVIYNAAKNTVTYVDNNSGKKSTFSIGVNPYTGADNLNDPKSKQYFAATNYGTFGNGYQPKGVKGSGKFTGWVGTDVINGNTQKVWQTADDKLWIWMGADNEYQLYDVNGDGKSDVKDMVRLKEKSVQ